MPDLVNVVSFISSSPADTQTFAKQLASKAAPGSIFCLEGPLGAGKTTLSKGFIASLTGEDTDLIQSPTFTYLQIYETSHVSICHFDLYRLSSEEDFDRLGFIDYLSTPFICLIEWPSKIPNFIPHHAHIVSLTHMNGDARAITLSSRGSLWS